MISTIRRVASAGPAAALAFVPPRVCIAIGRPALIGDPRSPACIVPKLAELVCALDRGLPRGARRVLKVHVRAPGVQSRLHRWRRTATSTNSDRSGLPPLNRAQ